jgi:heterodisulfide reductase subunit C
MDYLREKACQQGIVATRPQVELFHHLMLDSIYKRGRVAEVPTMMQYNCKIGKLFNESKMAAKMLLKGKLRPVMSSVKPIRQVRDLFDDGNGRKEE